MRRLLATIGVTIAVLAAVDRGVAVLLRAPGPIAEAVDVQLARDFTQAIAMNFDQLRADVKRFTVATHARWEAVPDQKSSRELRIVIIGNSSALYALAPWVVEERLAAAFPDRDVVVIPLLVPGVRVADELILVRAALAKHADVIVLTPNFKGLLSELSALTNTVRALFGVGLAGVRTRNPVAMVDGLLERYWLLYRVRSELRARLLAQRDPAAEEKRELHRAFDDITAAATRGDMRELVDVYHRHGMGGLVGGSMFRKRLGESSSVFDTVKTIATEVRAGHAIGIAIFLPMNPIFRDPALTADFQSMYVDREYIAALSARVLGIYRAAGFTTFDRVDALPAADFIDLVHANAAGMQAFSEDVATSLAAALRPSR